MKIDSPFAIALVLGAHGCGPAHGADPTLWEPSSTPADLGDPGADVGVTDAANGQATISFTTVSPAGKYAPRNVGAVWIEDARGAYVRTLAVWGAKRIDNLVAWRAASKADAVDAITEATRKVHGAHVVTWDLLDRGRMPVVTGVYTVRVEMTDSNAAKSGPGGPLSTFSLSIGGAAFATALPDETFFVERSTRYRP